MKINQWLSVARCMCAIVFALMTAPHAAVAQSYPSKPIRLIYAYPAGSTVHSSILLIAQEASKILGQPIIVDVKAGAGGRIGLDEVRRSPADGYVIGQATPGMLVLQGAVDPKLKLIPGNDYAPVIALADIPYVIVGHPSLPFRDIKGMLAYAKAQPGKLTVTGGALNTDSYFGAVRLKLEQGVDYLVVPFKGAVDAVPAQVNGLVDVTVLNGVVKPYVESGRMVALATTGAQRWDFFPSAPTLIESGVNMTMGTISGIIAPPGTPEPIVSRLNQVFARVVADPAVKTKLAELGMQARGTSVEDYSKLLKSEMDIWGPIVQKAGITPER